MSKKPDNNRYNTDKFDDVPKASLGGLAASIDDDISGHLLQKMGILKTFTISKILSNEDMIKLHEEVSKKSSNDKEFEKNMKDSFDKMSISNCKKDPIPGAIYNKSKKEEKNRKIEVENKNDTEKLTDPEISHLSEFSMLMADYIMKKKLSKKQASFVIISMVKILGLDHKNIDGGEEPPDVEDNEETD